MEGVGYVISATASRVCNINSTTQQACQRTVEVANQVGAAIQNTAQTLLQVTGMEETVNQVYRDLTSADDQSVSARIENVTGIPRGEIRQGISDAAVLGSVAVQGAVFRGLMPRTPRRLDYSRNYYESTPCFVNSPREFIGTLSRDLVVVNYHNSSPLGQGRKFAWAMVPAEANHLLTLDEVRNHAALLTKFQDYTHVSIARIPAGEQVRFLHGRAAQQVDASVNEFRPGGGVQYRFFDFDPRWIVDTRELPP